MTEAVPAATEAVPAATEAPISTVVMADDETIAAAKDGDPEAWRALYSAHAGRLVVWLRSLPTGDAGVSAEDLAAESWLTAASRIADFRGSADDFAGWLFGIARLQARNVERRSRRRMTAPTPVATLDLSVAAAPPAGLRPESDGWVAWLLSHLPPRERQVVACLDVVGLDVASTSRALGMTSTAVRVTHHRALKRLRGLGVAVD